MKEYCLKTVGQTIGLDKETMLMLIEEFFTVIDEELEKLDSFIKAGDAEQIRHIAHKMKGASANMMVEDMRKYCSDLQDADKADTELVESLFSNILSSYKEFKGLF